MARTRRPRHVYDMESSNPSVIESRKGCGYDITSPDGDKAFAVRHHLRGMPHAWIAPRMGRTEKEIRLRISTQWCQMCIERRCEFGCKGRRPKLPPIMTTKVPSGTGKFLSPAMAATVKEMYTAGKSYRDIAKQLKSMGRKQATAKRVYSYIHKRKDEWGIEVAPVKPQPAKVHPLKAAKHDWNTTEERHRQHVLLTLIEARERAVNQLDRSRSMGFQDLSDNIALIIVAFEAAIAILNDGNIMGKKTHVSLAS